MKSAKFYFLFFLLLLPLSASAHQPRIVENGVTTEIKNPEISQAFYGELTDRPAIFEIKAPEPFALYLGVLVPDLPSVKKNISALVTDQNDEKLYFLDGNNFSWKPFYEEFGGDNYFQGPEYRTSAKAGNYVIKISNPENRGKYVLAVGEKESFPPNEILNTLLTLPTLKKNFFLKSPFSALNNKIGMFLGLFILSLAVIIFILILIIKKLTNNTMKKLNFIIIPLITIIVAALGSYVTKNGMDWYSAINVPAYAPPGSIIGLIWTIIFILTTISAVIFWNRSPRNSCFYWIVLIFLLNAFLNVAWSYLFFDQHLIRTAALDSILLEISVLALVVLLWPISRLAASLLIPYSAWVAIATYLTFAIWLVNK